MIEVPFASIRAFGDMATLTAWLLGGLDEDERDDYEVVVGEFGDCWIKSYAPVEEVDIRPFELDDLIIAAPGSHPGGNCLWITPNPEVWISRAKVTA